jgi:flagellar M-ring protein FliF
VSAVDFVDAGHDLEPQPPPAVGEILLRQSGTVVNAATILAVTLLLIWFGLRPATKAILAMPGKRAGSTSELTTHDDLAAIEPGEGESEQLPNWTGERSENLIEDLTNSTSRSPQRRLEQIVEFNEGQAVAILKQWVHQGGRG